MGEKARGDLAWVVGATRRIPDGALVEVDGGAGTVRILDPD